MDDYVYQKGRRSVKLKEDGFKGLPRYVRMYGGRYINIRYKGQPNENATTDNNTSTTPQQMAARWRNSSNANKLPTTTNAPAWTEVRRVQESIEQRKECIMTVEKSTEQLITEKKRVTTHPVNVMQPT